MGRHRYRSGNGVCTLSVIWRLLFGREVGAEADTIREAIASAKL